MGHTTTSRVAKNSKFLGREVSSKRGTSLTFSQTIADHSFLDTISAWESLAPVLKTASISLDRPVRLGSIVTLKATRPAVEKLIDKILTRSDNEIRARQADGTPFAIIHR